MKIFVGCAVGLALVGALSIAPAQAGAARTFVSPTGNDAAACSLAAPCRTLAAAYTATNAGGEISVLGTAGYGTLTINKAISIVNPGGFEAGIAVGSGATGITINAGSNDVVSLRGLTLDGAATGATGIAFNSGKSLKITQSVVRNFTSNGIAFTNSTNATLFMTDTLISENGGHGVLVQPAATTQATVAFAQVKAVQNAGDGFHLATTLGNFDASAVDCVASLNTNGFVVSGPGSSPTFTLSRSAANRNLSTGASVSNSAILTVAQTDLGGNNQAWSNSGGTLNSYGDNYTQGSNLSTTAIGKN